MSGTTTLATSTSGPAASAAALTFGIADYLVFSLMLCASTAIGVYFGFFSKAKNTTEEYLRGGKKMQTLPIAVSLVASQLSGIAIMSVPAEIYTFGFNYFLVVIAMVVVVPILVYIIVPVFYENNVSNCYEYLEIRFSKLTRQLVTATFVMNSCLMLPVYMFIPSLAFSQVTGMNIHLINAMVSSVCVFYTMLGGIKAVVWTDVVQGGIMLISVIMVGVLGTMQAGGFSSVLENASNGGRFNFDFRLDPRIRVTVWNALIGGIFMWTGHIGLNQSCVQRIVSLPSYAHAKKSLVIAGIGFMIIMGMMNFTGIIMFARYYGCDPMLAGLVSKPDKMMPFFIQDIMGNLPGMPGLFISCVFSAALSTLSATLNSLAGVVYFDYIKPFIRHTEARANATMKLIIIGMGVYCIVGGYMVQNFSSIIQTVMSITGINTGAVVGVFLLGMLYPRANSKVAGSSILFSMLVMLWIIINAQMHFKSGLIKYDVLPNSLDQCEVSDLQMISDAIRNNSITEATSTSKPPLVTGAFGSTREFSIFDISFYWYKGLGILLTILWAIPMSYIWKPDKQLTQNPKLFTPFVRKFLKLNHVYELEELPLNGSQLKAGPELKIDLSETKKENTATS
ncbi:sodium-coupled monocarboxylate transporter 2-like [Drosophila novamexicana]|uniref:sodium-coupled monocarboxylate transporter 2-like n=1 Tax=Drosophila novamexicana TaxID=47314 RepID=UPI0011E5A843|nr:sodium-coupled monocarboxylate transporter 2-like [Drosophila novamexicana]